MACRPQRRPPGCRLGLNNLTKVIGWTLPTSGGVSLIIVAALLLGLTMPITPVQILWINMTRRSVLASSSLSNPAEPDIMQRPPRPADAPLLSGFLLWRIVFVSVLFAIGAFGMFAFAERRGRSHEAARTLVVNTVVVMEIFYLFSVRFLRTESVTLQGVLGTPAVLIGVGGTCLLQLAFTYLPVMQTLFNTRSIALADGLAIIGVGIAMLAAIEIEKRLVHAVG